MIILLESSHCVVFTFRGSDDDITDMVRVPDCSKFDDVSTILNLHKYARNHKHRFARKPIYFKIILMKTIVMQNGKKHR